MDAGLWQGEFNRVPKAKETETCASVYLFEPIRRIDPRQIVLLGGVAARKLLRAKSVEEVRGPIIERNGLNHSACDPPAVRFYREDLAEKRNEGFALSRRDLAKHR